jgi:AbrB family looped-hinge helix DNA binding protein
MTIELTRVSSKGQVVIPFEIRNKIGLKDGETLAVSTKDNLIVLKKIIDPLTENDIKTFNEIKEAWQEIDSGKAKKMNHEDFLKEISKW